MRNREEMKNRRCRVVYCLFLLLAMLARTAMEPFAAGGVAWDQYGDTRLEIDSRSPAVNQPFVANNLFPGDVLWQDYVVEVTHKGSILLQFDATVRPGYEKLAEVLMLKVEVEGREMYDGLMAEVPGSIGYLVQPGTSRAVVTPVDYTLTVYLDTSVGNEYQDQALVADFEWWVQVEETQEETDDRDGPDNNGDDPSGGGTGGSTSGGGPGTVPGSGGPQSATVVVPQPDGHLAYLPKTGDILVWLAGAAALSGVVLLLFIVLGKKRKEEDNAE